MGNARSAFLLTPTVASRTKLLGSGSIAIRLVHLSMHLTSELSPSAHIKANRSMASIITTFASKLEMGEVDMVAGVLGFTKTGLDTGPLDWNIGVCCKSFLLTKALEEEGIVEDMFWFVYVFVFKSF